MYYESHIWINKFLHSAFMFEKVNGYLLRQIKSSNAVPQQICRKATWSRALPSITKEHLSSVSPEVGAFFTEMTSTAHSIRNCVRYERVTALGVPQMRFVSENDLHTLHAIQDVPTNCVGSYYSRIVVNGEVIHSQTYTRTKKINNSFVILKDGSLFNVSYFLCVSDNEQHLYAIGRFGNCTVQKLAWGSTVRTSLSYMKSVYFATGLRGKVVVDSNDIVIHYDQSGPIVCKQIYYNHTIVNKPN